jgi:NAD(P)-dependent dehydrogenase (short-subunit alcohol dehydrogenase family)
MKQFEDKVAVITGAASGIGKAISMRCAQEKMKIVMADIEAEALKKSAREIELSGADLIHVVTDVSKEKDMKYLAQTTMDTYGAVHLLFNNAGIAVSTPSSWEGSISDWEWSLGVNLWGVIHGIRTFVPIMLEQHIQCHIVNTSSMAGLMVPPGGSPYVVSKHSVVALSEVLYHELTLRDAQIGVSVLCPGFVNTSIIDSERNRPDHLKNAFSQKKQNNAHEARIKKRQKAIETGMPAKRVADATFNAIRHNTFYIITHAEETMEPVHIRMNNILNGQNPTLPPRST